MRNYVNVKLNSIDNAKEFTKICEMFDEDIDYVIGRYTVDAKSLLGILSTTLGKIAKVTIHTRSQNILEHFLNSIYKWIVEESIWKLG